MGQTNTGLFSESAGTANKPSDNATGSTASASAAIQFNVEKVKKLSDTCAAPASNK